MSISATYDQEVDALYVRVTPGEVARTVELDECILVDVDASGQVLGIEILYPSTKLDLDAVLDRLALNSLKMQIVSALADAGAPVSATVTGSATQLIASTNSVVLRSGTAANSTTEQVPSTSSRSFALLAVSS